MPELLPGIRTDRVPSGRYFERLRFVELEFNAPLPRVTKLQRPTNAERALVSLVVPPASMSTPSGPMRLTDDVLRSQDWVASAAAQLGAQWVLVRTPYDLSPGQRDRDILAKYVDALRTRTNTALAWEPRGPWENESAEAFANALGLVRVVDPWVDTSGATPHAYARMLALGARARLHTSLLLDALERIAAWPADSVVVAVDAPDAHRHAVALAAALAGEPSDDDEDDDDEGLDDDA